MSLGLQGLQDKELKVWEDTFCGRCYKSYRSHKSGRFDNINFDLIYGIPGQTITDWMHCLQQAIDYQPHHISMYLLQLEPQVPMSRAIAAGQLALPEEAEVEAMYYRAVDSLHDKGLKQYEISNFARDGYACRHNLRYWQFGEYLGFGAAAVSRLGGLRWMNAADLIFIPG